MVSPETARTPTRPAHPLGDNDGGHFRHYWRGGAAGPSLQPKKEKLRGWGETQHGEGRFFFSHFYMPSQGPPTRCAASQFPLPTSPGNASSKSSRRIPKSAVSNGPLEADAKSTTPERCQCATCVEQHDNAGQLVQQQEKVSDSSKRCESVQGFEKGLTEHSHLSPIREVSLKDAMISKKSDSAFVDSISTFGKGTMHNKESSRVQSSDQHNMVRSTPVFLESAERKCTSLCREEPSSETFPGQKGFLLEKKSEILSQKTVHKESVGTPLRTFCRRAKKLKEVIVTGVSGHSKVVRGEGSASEQSMTLDAICKSEEPSTRTPEVKKPQVNASHEDSTRSLVANEKERSKVSAVHSIDGCKSTIKQGEERPVEVRSSHCSNDSMKESSSGANHRGKQFKVPKTRTVTGDVPAISSVDAAQVPTIRGISNECAKTDIAVSNPSQSDELRVDINLCESALSKTTPSPLCETRKPDNASLKDLFHSQSSSNSAVHEANGGEKGLELLETLERQKQRVICTSRADVDINCTLAFGEDDTLHQLSRSSPLPDPVVLDFLRETTNHTGSPQRRNFVRNVGNSFVEGQWGTQATRTICMDFLGPVHTQRENTIDPIKNFRSMSPVSSVKGTGYSHEVQLPWQASDSNSSILRHKQILDDILTSSRMLNKRHDYYFANCRRFPSLWSEEELDSLWIGVRRHGRGNWNAMLCDPKLHFAGWRIADDLAERWDVEQAKLLSTPLVQPLRSLEPDTSSTSIISNRLLSNSAVDSSHRNYLPELQNSRNEMGLSLGGVYLKKEVKNTIRNPSHLSDFAVHSVAVTSSLGAGSSYNYRGHQRHPPYTDPGSAHQRLGKSQGRYDLGPTMLEQNSLERLPGSGHQIAALPTSTNLPHWLKEVLGTPASPSEQTLLSTVSTFEHPTVSHAGDQRVVPPFSYPNEQLTPLKDARRGILKRRGTKSNNAGSLGLPTLKSAESKVSDANIFDLNRSSSEAIEQNNLVIIDGDASSEETISDDQSGRP
ncbi:hypothetical protein Taro_005458 [Colocasia esculenta]|uniref:Uncharacterized protein n=1 Tax=Colocasia esculenta TaxID=4460 RepID=A0A843TUP2_COLES|nr:hypothetical protein [Colocasia esculenta]